MEEKRLVPLTNSDGQVVKVVWHDKAELPKVFAAIRTECLTTFHLPHKTVMMKEFHVPAMALDKMPFDCFAVTEPFTIPAALNKQAKTDVHGVEESVLCRVDKENLLYVSKLRFEDGTVVYQPDAAVMNTQTFHNIPELFFRFYNLLYSRKFRFVDEPLSRQVRRANKLPAAYREFIVIGREDVRYAKGIPASAMVRRMRTLHFVRGHDRVEHLRQYKDGKIIVVSSSWIPPHARGEGKLTQAKDYKLN